MASPEEALGCLEDDRKQPTRGRTRTQVSRASHGLLAPVSLAVGREMMMRIFLITVCAVLAGCSGEPAPRPPPPEPPPPESDQPLKILMGKTKERVRQVLGAPDDISTLMYTYPDTRHLSTNELRALQRSMPDEFWQYSNGVRVSFSGDEVVGIGALTAPDADGAQQPPERDK